MQNLGLMAMQKSTLFSLIKQANKIMFPGLVATWHAAVHLLHDLRAVLCCAVDVQLALEPPGRK